MSGGIDSSAACMILQEQGYEVIGLTMRMWDLPRHFPNEGQTIPQFAIEAKELAEKIGIEHHILDVRDDFKRTVIKSFTDEYLKGNTPNPCVLCNKQFKWHYLLQEANRLNCQWVATGHYARISRKNNRFILNRGADPKKDQSYFLWRLGQQELARTIFPLGDITKEEIKQYVESLRTLRHEHLNWMSTLNGLLQMKEYDRVLAMVQGESQAQQQLIDSLREAFADRQVAGLLFGKVQRARELGLKMIIVPGSQLSQLPPGLDSTEFAAIVGNLLDNAFEASLRSDEGNKIVELFLSDEGDDVVIEVADQGCGVPESLRDKIFEQGVSTRADEPGEHGIGLYLIASYVTRCGGVITLEDNDPCGTLFSIYIPKVKPNDSSINPIDR